MMPPRLAWTMPTPLAWLMLALLSAGRCLAAAPLDGVLACRQVAEPSARLACFDRETAALNRAAIPALPAMPATAAAAPAAAPAAPPALPEVLPAALTAAPDPSTTFGMSQGAIAAKEVAAGARPAAVSRIESRLAAVSPAADGRLIFTLDNGEVWTQLSREGEMLAAPGDQATISRGALGSYWLELKSRRGCKVRRIR